MGRFPITAASSTGRDDTIGSTHSVKVDAAAVGAAHMRFRPYSRFRTFAFIASLALLASRLGQAQSGGTLKGVVLDRGGAVIVDAGVSLYSKYGTLHMNSDRMGQFEFVDLSPGTYKLEVKSHGFQTATIQPIHIKREDATLPPLTVIMEVAVMGGCGELSSVSYEERKPDSAPLVGVIEPMPPTPEPNVAWPYIPFSEAIIEVLKAENDLVVVSTHPDDRGKFEFARLAVGEYRIRAKCKGYFDESSVKFEITREDVTKVTIQLIPQDNSIVCE